MDAEHAVVIATHCASCGAARMIDVPDGGTLGPRDLRCPECFLLDKDTRFVFAITPRKGSSDGR
jgi:hypothetical protein